ncbi:MAG: hypothetical protein UY35_C0009G0004 [Candidatus Saccharibacteria bacterium GW2011_GWC2_48_9]|nr:MAG: hypothetical protein UY35_C0009G0004 [Candidatus Saccharibacteria bacterium GW2011_GWC2_48_9]
MRHVNGVFDERLQLVKLAVGVDCHLRQVQTSLLEPDCLGEWPKPIQSQGVFVNRDRDDVVVDVITATTSEQATIDSNVLLNASLRKDVCDIVDRHASECVQTAEIRQQPAEPRMLAECIGLELPHLVGQVHCDVGVEAEVLQVLRGDTEICQLVRQNDIALSDHHDSKGLCCEFALSRFARTPNLHGVYEH